MSGLFSKIKIPFLCLKTTQWKGIFVFLNTHPGVSVYFKALLKNIQIVLNFNQIKAVNIYKTHKLYRAYLIYIDNTLQSSIMTVE